MSIEMTRRLASRILKCGQSRVSIKDANKAKGALTSQDVRGQIKEGLIIKKPEKGTGRGKARTKQSRKRAGRRRGEGSRKGSPNSRQDKKTRWMKKVRAQRKTLKKEKASISTSSYREFYSKIKGNYYRTKKHLQTAITESKQEK
ncbi:MAG: 50S ribosomal protein L19e [Candidatus Micrarchaeia archaeon]